MNFYVIPPLSNLQLMHHGQRYFCLAQLFLKSEEYREFFYSLPPDSWITLDNGVGDFAPVSAEQLLEVAKDLKPNEVIPPDVLFDGLATANNARKFHKLMLESGLGHIEVLFCPQGRTQNNWLTCYEWGLRQDWITTIGLSKIGVPNAFLQVSDDKGIMEARHNCFNYLKVHGLLEKQLHLLGMGDPREFAYYKRFDEGKFIRSSDSCNSVWSAMNGFAWSRGQFDRIPTPIDYFNRRVDNEQLVRENVDHLLWMLDN